MANLPETPNQYPAGIYQLEENDPVQGGPNGIDNRQAKQLADRTNYLKGKADDLKTKDEAQDRSIEGLETRVQTIENDGTGDNSTPVQNYWWR